MNKFICTFILFCLVKICPAQLANPDSLKMLLSTSQTDSARFKTYMSLCSHYQDTNFDSLFYFAKQGLDLAIKVNNPAMKSHAWAALGQRQYLLGNYPSALELLFKSLQLAESIKDTLGLARSHNLIGVTYKEYGEYEEAKKHFFQCKAFADKADIPDFILFSNMNLGQIYYYMDIPDSAMIYEQVAYSTALKTHSKWTGAILLIFGQIHDKLNHKDLSLVNYKQGISDFKSVYGNSRILSKGYLYLGIFFNSNNMKDSAIFYAHLSMSVAKAVPYLKGIADAGKFLGNMYDSLQKTDSAYYYQKIFIQYNDSINTRAKVAGVENLTLLEQIRQQDKKESEHKLKIEHRQNIQYALIALGIVTFIIIFLLLSRSFITNTKLIEYFGILALLIVFEFLNLLLHPFLENITHHSPVLMLMALVSIAALLIPMHHKVEKWATKILVEKNKKIRLEAARKTIEKLQDYKD